MMINISTGLTQELRDSKGFSRFEVGRAASETAGGRHEEPRRSSADDSDVFDRVFSELDRSSTPAQPNAAEHNGLGIAEVEGVGETVGDAFDLDPADADASRIVTPADVSVQNGDAFAPQGDQAAYQEGAPMSGGAPYGLRSDRPELFVDAEGVWGDLGPRLGGAGTSKPSNDTVQPGYSDLHLANGAVSDHATKASDATEFDLDLVGFGGRRDSSLIQGQGAAHVQGVLQSRTDLDGQDLGAARLTSTANVGASEVSGKGVKIDGLIESPGFSNGVAAVGPNPQSIESQRLGALPSLGLVERSGSAKISKTASTAGEQAAAAAVVSAGLGDRAVQKNAGGILDQGSASPLPPATRPSQVSGTLVGQSLQKGLVGANTSVPNSTFVADATDHALQDAKASRAEHSLRAEPSEALKASTTQPTAAVAAFALRAKPAGDVQALEVERRTFTASEPEVSGLGRTGSAFGVEGSAQARANQAQLFQSPDLPRHVMQQMADAMRLSADRRTELLLNPAELGRVRISLSTGDIGLVVSISADRPETLDLMRRHADQLVQEFRDIGYDTAEFDFGQNSPGQSGPEQRSDDRTDYATDADPEGTVAPPPQPTQIVSLDRVDLRL